MSEAVRVNAANKRPGGVGLLHRSFSASRSECTSSSKASLVSSMAMIMLGSSYLFAHDRPGWISAMLLEIVTPPGVVCSCRAWP